MKRLGFFLVILTIIAHSAVRTGVFIHWKIYQTEIANKYCENKNRPEMQCNGQCYLAKQMRAITNEYEQSKSSFPPINGKIVDFPMCLHQLDQLFITMPTYLERSKVHFSYNASVLSNDLQIVSPPPQLFS